MHFRLYRNMLPISMMKMLSGRGAGLDTLLLFLLSRKMHGQIYDYFRVSRAISLYSSRMNTRTQ